MQQDILPRASLQPKDVAGHDLSPGTNTRNRTTIDGVFQPRLVRPEPFSAPVPVEEVVQPQVEATPEAEEAAETSEEEAVQTKRRMNPTYAMAGILFFVGMAVAVQGFITNGKAEQQVAVLSATAAGEHGPGEPGGAPAGLSEDEVTQNDIAGYQVAPNMPRFIRSDTIGVNARVLTVGKENGAVGTPEGIFDAAWYDGSAKITDSSGAMLVVGHVSGPSQPGVFKNLHTLNAGDIIEIEQGNGVVKKFQVTDKHTYNVGSVNMAKALSSSSPGGLGLNLMTCGGAFDVESNTFQERVLVRTMQIS